MFKPFNLLVLMVGLYLLFPALGFGLFPEYFNFSESTENFVILGCYISAMLISTLAAKKAEGVGHHQRAISNNQMHEMWISRNSERRAFVFVSLAGVLSLIGLLFVIVQSGTLGDEFSPHALRMSIASSGDLGLIVGYNLICLLIIVSTNLTIVSLAKAERKSSFGSVLALFFLLIIATGQRSLIMLALCSYLFLQSTIETKRRGLKKLFILTGGLCFVILLGVVRQGDDFGYESLIWQASVRFDMFFPQFFNFLDVFRSQDHIDYGYYHLTYPLQIIPSSLMQDKPVTFLQFINRDLMKIAEETGNDFSAFAEFIYNYGIVIGLFFYSAYCFVASFFICRIYRRANESPVYFALYFPCFLVYLSLVLLTGLSNQAHIFSVAGLLLAIYPCRLFVKYTESQKKGCSKKRPQSYGFLS